jgi:hypothetical protein
MQAFAAPVDGMAIALLDGKIPSSLTAATVVGGI